jgi:hypothetical protein
MSLRGLSARSGGTLYFCPAAEVHPKQSRLPLVAPGKTVFLFSRNCLVQRRFDGAPLMGRSA